ncbi:MAG: class I SAM-dependent methyltransferase [Sandaracinaceae bacterium]|nr:class I SAM-dependent methyltransferase [Sandaracinaceae bacterium]
MRIFGVLMIALLASACGSKVESPEPSESAGDELAAPEVDVSESEAEEAPPTPSIDEILQGEHRSDEERARDAYRHPRETLAFFGVEPGKDVLELAPGGGWYTRILAPLLRHEGSLTVGLPDGRYGDTFRKLAEEDPEFYGSVRTVRLAPQEGAPLGEPESYDVALTFRNIHGWINAGIDEAVFTAVFNALRPGGVFGVVQHREVEGRELDASRGYVPEAYVIALAEKVGFELDERSEINANPKDTKDHASGVFSLPPAMRGDEPEEEKARLAEIGESDRMTLRFKKPAN